MYVYWNVSSATNSVECTWEPHGKGFINDDPQSNELVKLRSWHINMRKMYWAVRTSARVHASALSVYRVHHLQILFVARIFCSLVLF